MLTITEIYASVQGESTHAGRPCVFVRLTACDCRCAWCDTPYAFSGGRRITLDDLLKEVAQHECRLVEITGGEPLLQGDVYPLMQRLLDEGHDVLLETGGHVPTDSVPAGVVTILDVKCPGSGEAGRTHWANLDRLSPQDEVKFVIKDRLDFDYACGVVARYGVASRARAVLFSPVHGVLPPDDLAQWILETRAPARLQLQIHKYVWDPAARGV